MTRLMLLAATLALSTAAPIAGARADCTTPTGRDTMRAKYSQAMISWSQRDPKGYAEAQEQLRQDQAVARRNGEQRLCAFYQRSIRLSRQDGGMANRP